MISFSYSLCGHWTPDRQSAAETGDKLVETLDALAALDPLLTDWSVIGGSNRPKPLAKVRHRITKVVEEEYEPFEGEPFVQEGEHLVMALNTTVIGSKLGEKTFEFSVKTGSRRDNSVELLSGWRLTPPDPEIIRYEVFKGALTALARIWPCSWVNAYAFSDGYWKRSPAQGAPPSPYSLFHMAWIAYLSAPMAAGLTPPADLLCEPTPGGGMILSAVRERLDPTDPDHLRRARLLAEIMIERLGDEGQKRSPRVGPY